MAMIELRTLQYFVVVAEELNFGRAANRLQMAQPPLSRQIQRLERELGVELFQRLNRRIQLTLAGRVLFQEAQLILAQVETAIVTTQRAGRGETGQFTIGFEGSFSYDIMPRAVKAFQDQYPEVELAVQEITTGQQEQALLEKQIDLGFIVPPLADPALSVETVLREKLVLVVPATHPLASQAEVSITDLDGTPFITGPREKGCGLYIQILQSFAEAGVHPQMVQSTREIQMLLGFVAAGLGVSLLPAVNQFFQRPGIVYRSLQSPIPEIELAIAWRSDNPSPILRHFLAIVRSLTASNRD